MPTTLKQLVCLQSQTVTETMSYLRKLAWDCAELPEYYPEHLQAASEDGRLPVDNIQQTVQVLDRYAYDEWLAQEQERRRAAGERDVPYLAYSQNLHDMEPGSEDHAERKPPEMFEWADDTNDRFQRIILLGDPGFGKTWLLRWETRRLISQASRQAHRPTNGPQSTYQAIEQRVASLEDLTLPIFVRLANLAKDERAIEQVLVEQAAPNLPHLQELLLQKLHQQDGCVILLDAWNEVSRTLQNKLAKRLIQFTEDLPHPKLILTSRIVGYEPKLEKISQAKVLVLTAFYSKQIQAFVDAWFDQDQQRSADFCRALQSTPRVDGLSQIPLILTLLCRIPSLGTVC